MAHNDSSTSIAEAGSDGPSSRQVVDGFFVDNVAAAQSAQEMSRTGGRWRALRVGSIVGVLVSLESSQVRTAGTLTVEVYVASINPATGARTETATGLTAVLDASSPAFKLTTQNPGVDPFAVGDEVFLRYTTDGSWAPTTGDIKAAFMVRQ